jgi:hypothetical protein
MKEKIFASLKKACGNNTSISDKTLEKIAETMSATIKEESEIEAAIEVQKPILQAIDGNINHIASEAVKKVKAESLDKPGDSDEPKKGPGRPRKAKDVDPDNDSDEGDEKIPEWAKKILAKNAELEQKIEKQVQEKTLASLAEKVSKHDKLKDIPQTFLKGRNLVPQSEAEIDQLVATIESDYNGFKQEMAEKGVIVSVPPAGGGAEGDGKVTIQDYLNEKFPKV